MGSKTTEKNKQDRGGGKKPKILRPVTIMLSVLISGPIGCAIQQGDALRHGNPAIYAKKSQTQLLLEKCESANGDMVKFVNEPDKVRISGFTRDLSETTPISAFISADAPISENKIGKIVSDGTSIMVCTALGNKDSEFIKKPLVVDGQGKE